MVASISKAGSADYYLDLANQDYYADAKEEPGTWMGSGSHRLGIAGEIDKEPFKHIWEGRSPQGDALVQNAGSTRRTPGWDITFSAPKSVSALWAVAPEHLREKLEKAHQESVQDSIRYLEKNAAYTRRGSGGEFIENTTLVVGTFQHGASREQDPTLHTHAIVLNVGVGEDGHTSALDSRPLYQHKMAAGAVYRSTLATRLQEIGFEIETRDKGLFDVQGVPEEVTQGWSKRSQSIGNYLKEQQLEDTPENRAKAAVETRQHKADRSRDDLRAEWQEAGNRWGWTAEQVEELRQDPPERSRFMEERAKQLVLEEAIEKVSFGKSTFFERDLDRAIAESAIGKGLTYDQLQEVKHSFVSSRDAVELASSSRYDREFTTLQQIETELTLKHVTSTLAERKGRQIQEQALFEAMSSREMMSDEQRKALTHVTSRGDIKVVSGYAGTGKTFFLDAAREVWQENGYDVRGLALSGKAAAGLQEGAKIESSTLDSFFAKLDAEREALDSCSGAYGKDVLTATADSLFETPRGGLHRDSVLVVDEAGMVDTARMTRLLQEAEAAGAKVVLVGDSKQLQPVEAGGAFQSITAQVGEVELTTIRRQQHEWAQDATHRFREGDAESGLFAYSSRNLVTVRERKTDLYDALIEDWSNQGGAWEAENHLILANTNHDVDALNTRAQRVRKEAGELGETHIHLNGHTIHEGDRILFRENSSQYDVKNGQMATVQRIDLLRKQISVLFDDQKSTQTINVKDYDAISLGYAVTTHKSQGMTVEHSYVLAGGAMQDRELSYVQMSRHKESARIYAQGDSQTEAMQTLATEMNRSREKRLAVDRLAIVGQREQERERVRELG